MKTKFLLLVFILCSWMAIDAYAQLGAKQYKKRSSSTGSSNSIAPNTIMAAKGSRIIPLQLGTGFSVNKILRSAETSRPIYVETSNLLKSTSFSTPEQKCLSFLKQLAPVLGLANPEIDFKVSKVQTDDFNETHVRITQMHKGIPIEGSDAYVHLSPIKTIFHGTYDVIDESLTTQATASPEQAINNSLNDIKYRTTLVELDGSQKKFLDYSGPEATLVYYKSKYDQKHHLAYQILIRPNFRERWKYFVDATTGSVLHRYNCTQSDGPQKATANDLNSKSRLLNTYLLNGTYYMIDASQKIYSAAKSKLPNEPVGAIWTVDGKNTKVSEVKVSHISSKNNTDWNATAVSAHYGAIATYNYYKNTYNRNSLDGDSSTIISIINVIDENGSSLENAFWNGKAMFFGNGGTYFKPLAGGLDVVAHELGHGVIEHTANLEYQDQSGALNESFADISGVMVDDINWTLGEDITKKTTAFPDGILRNMADPHNGGSSSNDACWQPSSMAEYVTGTDDNGGVHANSGIPNRAFYLYATATGMTRAKAGAIYYDVLKNYLTKYATFNDLRIAVLASAKKQYGQTAVEYTAAVSAFDQVGIVDQGSSPTANTDLQVSSGTQGILYYDTDAHIWKSDENGGNIKSLYDAPAYRCSLSDDGSVMVFVDLDMKIRIMNPTAATPTSSIIYNDTIFRSVAVSKDGLKIAAVRFKQDTAIWVAKLSDMKWKKYRLLNPTTVKGQVSAGVLRADVVEWDYSGEKIVYDAYNEIPNSDGGKIDFWDVGVINVWDNKTSTFKDSATFVKLFPSLPEFVSLGDPTFSKTSPNIIAFDYFYNDGSKIDCKVLGYNILTDSLAVIAQTNATLGYPSFSKADDKIVYASTSDSLVAENNIVSMIGLNASKFNPTGTATNFMSGVTSAIYYNTTQRNLGNPPVANFQIVRKSVLGVYYQAFLDQSLNKPTSWQWTIDGPLFGTLYILGTENDPNPVISFVRDGTYQITLTVKNQYGSNSVSKSITIGTTAVNEEEEINTKVYPNPFTDQILVQSSQAFTNNAYVKLYDVSGALIKSEPAKDKTEVRLETSSLLPGLYILEVYSGKSLSKQKFIKQ